VKALVRLPARVPLVLVGNGCVPRWFAVARGVPLQTSGATGPQEKEVLVKVPAWVPARVSVMGRWGRVLMLQVLVPSLFAEFEIP